jgi:hypothetical protein
MHKLYNARIQFILPGKARQTFANFSANFHPNLTKIESICPWAKSFGPTIIDMSDIFKLSYRHTDPRTDTYKCF